MLTYRRDSLDTNSVINVHYYGESTAAFSTRAEIFLELDFKQSIVDDLEVACISESLKNITIEFLSTRYKPDSHRRKYTMSLVKFKAHTQQTSLAEDLLKHGDMSAGDETVTQIIVPGACQP